MKFIIEKQVLESALAQVVPFSARRSNIEAMKCVRIEAVKGQVSFSCCNGEAWGTLATALVDVQQPGTIQVDAPLFASIAGSHAGPTITIAVEDAKAVIRSASGVTRLWVNTQTPPPLPTPDENAASFEVNAAQFARAVDRCSWAHAENNSRSSIKGQIFTVEPKAFRVYATDGSHLAYAMVPIKTSHTLTAVVPDGFADAVAKMQSEDGENANVTIDSRTIGVSVGGYTFGSLLMEAAPPPVRDYIGKRDGAKVQIGRESAMEAVAASMRTMDTLGTVAIVFKAGKDTANVYTMDAARGASRMTFAVPSPIDADVKVGFKPKMLLEAIRACGSEHVTFYVTKTSKGPSTMVGSDGFEAVLMPRVPEGGIDAMIAGCA